ncbi:MAG: YbaN family protein [Streptococcaceae bacterium]|jgi:uncharacterized membrane protein YbaN (DUF454 family)|nr:YbaN family protein [Streptococcaceae bacterium]
MKILNLFIGLVFVGLGVLGAILPVLPTTPFLLVALFFLSKSSAKAERIFKNSWLYHRFLKHYDQTRSLTAKEKRNIQILATLMIGIAFLIIHSLYLRILLLILLCIHHYVFIFRIPTSEQLTTTEQTTEEK